MQITRIIHNAKTGETKVKRSKLSEKEIAEREQEQKIIEEELLMEAFLMQKEEDTKAAVLAEFEEWKAQKRGSKKGK